MTASLISMKILKIMTLVMSCLPIVFVVSLLTYYYWWRHFIATQEHHELASWMGILSRLTHWLGNGTLYTFLPNLIFMLVLIGHSRVEKKSITTNLVVYGLGIAMLVYLFFIDGSNLLPWYWD